MKKMDATAARGTLRDPVWVGLGGAGRHACAAICTAHEVLGICEQERVTRVKGAGFNSTGLPDEAIDVILARTGFTRASVIEYAYSECPPPISEGIPSVRLDHHFMHACAAFLASPFESATVVVCDSEAPHVSVWTGSGETVSAVAFSWFGPGFTELYSQSARALGFYSPGGEQRMEALARLDPGRRDERIDRLFRFDGNRVDVAPRWLTCVDAAVSAATSFGDTAALASALQTRIGDLLLDFLADIRDQSPAGRPLCLGGSLFQNSYFNSQVKGHAGYSDVFVPVNPGDAGLAVAAALYASGGKRRPTSPFLGPAYDGEEIKATLDNCKLNYQWMSERESVAAAVEFLQRGRLVGWFDGPMEWGPRALGARSILASPFSPFVLDNLNRFLKQRETWRGYALSGLAPAVQQHLDGPSASPYMECDYRPRDLERFRHALPEPTAGVRVQTVGEDAPPHFRELLEAFGQASGIPMLVNTSFNAFSEPIVCTPRDAVRVFYGTGLDMLVLGQFVITK
jgi:carbamoyltransferase